MLFLLSFAITKLYLLKKTNSYLPFVLGFILMAGLVSCNSQKESLSSRGMQNLTARYNILFNARELVKESELNIQTAYPNNYDRLLPVFTESTSKLAQSEFKKLDEAILKATVVANEKSQSKFVDDAYLLVGIANHLKADHFNAVEYFNYVYDNYPKEKDIRQAALVWKGRALMELKRFEEAQASLDTAIKYVKTSKKTVAEAYASRAQLHLYAQENEQAVDLLSKAIKASPKKSQRIRWTYLLAQLEQQQGNLKSAYKHYSEVVSSNAPFEMAFNANLNRISIEERQGDKKVNREQSLRALLKDEKNLDFTDQIYYRIARDFEQSKQLDKAIENYNISIQKNTRNQDQRGLSYLALAEVYFKKADYVKAKKYYDSTLTAMPAQHPDYKLIIKKSSNLDLLAKNLMIIAEEDTLQMLARLPEKERMAKLDLMISQQIKPISTASNQNSTTDFGNFSSDPAQKSADTKFYFNNSAALSQGFSDFKRKWGNRKLEDNWRRSERSISDLSGQGLSGNKPSGNGENPNAGNKNEVSPAEELKNDYLFKIPNTPDKLAASNLKIANAYFEVGDYYREILNDKPEAIRAFETLIRRQPNYSNRSAVYYNLYRLYAETDPKKSEEFKNKILNEFSTSVFAKVILDPEFGQKQDEQDLALGRAYNEIFECFIQKDYTYTMAFIKQINTQYEKNRLSAQLAYLNSISGGHQQNLTAFEPSLKAIVANYPEDKLITPLVKQHLLFIDANRESLAKRIVVLTDQESRFFMNDEEPPKKIKSAPVEIKIAAANNPNPVVEITLPAANTSATADTVKATVETIKPLAAAIEAPADTIKTIQVEAKTVTPEPDKIIPKPRIEAPQIQKQAENKLFDLKDTDHYYMVINVKNPDVNLSSSRYGIGQFNRANFAERNIKHQLIELNENQLIFVGEFTSRDEAAEYYKNISTLMRDIMKVGAVDYSLFIITKANLDRIKDHETLNQYLQFYKDNYQL